MIALLVYALTGMGAVLLAHRANRSALSLSVMFLVVGILVGKSGLGLLEIGPQNPLLAQLATYALFSTLLTDGMKVGWRDLSQTWDLPGRALLLGMPITLILLAGAAHYVVGLPWLEAFLIGAVLSPTDPVFAAAIVERPEIPRRLRQLLNVESGLNDGLALPFVLVFLTLVQHGHVDAWQTAKELVGGVALGVIVPYLATRVEGWKVFHVEAKNEPLFAFSLGLTVFALAQLSGVNAYLAAFSTGITIASVRCDLRDEFEQLSRQVSQLLKLAAVLAFGLLIVPAHFLALGWRAYAFAALALLVARPLAIFLSLVGSKLGWREQLIAAWFGPKGFASVIYGVLVLKSGAAHGPLLFHLDALVIALSIIAHSSSDVPVAHWFKRQQPPAAAHDL